MRLPIHGRARELDALDQHLGVKGGAIVVIGGPAGSGKSHLADASTERHSRWWISFPHPKGAAPASGLKQLAGLSLSRDFQALLAEERGAGSAKRRQAIFAAADVAISSGRPDVIVLDDAQWADGLSLDWLSHWANGPQARPTSLLLTVRVDSSSRPSVDRVLEEIAANSRRLHRIVLEPLSVEAIRHLAADLGWACDEDEAQELAARTGGNPLFARELCFRRIRNAAPGMESRAPYARSLEQVVREQIQELGEETCRLVRAVALGPNPMKEELALRAAGLERGAFEIALEEAIDSGLLVTSEGSLTFYHELPREAVEQQIRLSERRRLHHLIARLLSVQADAHPLHVARQLLAAGDTVEATDWLTRAGLHAARTSDHSGAIDLFAEALKHCPPQDAPKVTELAAELVRSARVAGRPDPALRALRELKDRFEASPAAGQVWLAMSRISAFLDDYEGRTEALREAERRFHRWQDRRGQAMALADLSYPVGTALTHEQRLDYGRRAVRLVEELDDHFLYVICAAQFADLGFEAAEPGALNLLRKTRETLDVAVVRERTEYLRESTNLAYYEFWQGNLRAAREAIAQGRSMAGDSFWHVALGFGEGLADWRGGIWNDAVAQFENATADGSMGFYKLGEAIRLSILFEQGTAIQVEQLERAAADLDEMGEGLWAPLALALCVQVRAWRREPNPTRGVVRRVKTIVEIGQRAGWQDLLPVVAGIDVPLYVRIWGELESGLPTGSHPEACSMLAEGIRLAAIERSRQAADALENSARAFEATGDPYYEARSWDALSRSSDSVPRARRAAERAAELYATIGANRSLARLVRASRRRGILSHHPIPASERGKGAPGLTKREEQVALLAAQGHTAREIAEELVLSIATVRKHIERIKSKLGVRRKHELVRLLHE